MEEDKKKKDLIKIEIMDQGFELLDFITYFDQQHPEADSDLEKVNYEILENIINEFKDQYFSTQLSEFRKSNIEEDSNTNDDELNQSNDKKNQNDLNQNNRQIRKQQQQQQNYDTAILSEDNSEISRKSYQNNQLKNSSVQRRFNDFLRFRETLQKFFPEKIIPPISAKKNIRNLQESYLSKRKKVLENFLQYIVYDLTLVSSSLVSDFLQVQNVDVYSELLNKRYQNQKEIQHFGLNQFQTLNGKVIVNANELKYYSKYAQIYENYQKEIENVYKFIKKKSKKLQQQLIAFQDQLAEITDKFTKLEQITQQFNENQFIKQEENFQFTQKIYQNLSNFTQNWCNCFHEQSDLLNKNFHTFFRFQTKQNETIKEFNKQRNNVENLYMNEYKKCYRKNPQYLKNSNNNTQSTSSRNSFISNTNTNYSELEFQNDDNINNKNINNIEIFYEQNQNNLEMPMEAANQIFYYNQNLKILGQTYGIISEKYYEHIQQNQHIKNKLYIDNINELLRNFNSITSDMHLKNADIQTNLDQKLDKTNIILQYNLFIENLQRESNIQKLQDQLINSSKNQINQKNPENNLNYSQKQQQQIENKNRSKLLSNNEIIGQKNQQRVINFNVNK
ncbi:Phox homologous domain [Pseudocohnilembus persalinus]|uniref:Phox homologous domain n=1 Tax=Pseudocohnilembus persalinus TaxID=266149 RepID=A0A0V0QWL4_PSEPJ|nr:Phox homologous domain [Pseudocohnilembus persalinus]|eukprot:KRX06626.1 Phox homologous domain [Pseudocohnilembus persalinus]